MRVKPYKSSKKLEDNNARVIIVDRNAVDELLRETLIENMCKYFNLKPSSDLFCKIYWDNTTEELIFMVLSHKNQIKNEINTNYIRKKLGKTTTSFFNRCCYRTITFPQKTD